MMNVILSMYLYWILYSVFISFLSQKALRGTWTETCTHKVPEQCTFSCFCHNIVRRIPENLPTDRPETNVAQTKTQDAATAKPVLNFAQHFLLMTTVSTKMLSVCHIHSRTESRPPAWWQTARGPTINDEKHPFQLHARILNDLAERRSL